MTDIVEDTRYQGRANMVMTLSSGEDATAVISSVVARVRNNEIDDRICFTGPATFDEKAVRHIVDVALPIADEICGSLGLPQKRFEVSVVNLGAASINDIGLKISGYSGDLSTLMAILSSCLEIAIPQDIVFCGHVASVDGDIRMVRSLPAKLKAAIEADSITTFVHPAIDQDGSLMAFSLKEKQRVAGAISKAKSDIRTVAVHDVGELLQKILTEEQVVLSSLGHGFYQTTVPLLAKETPIGKAVSYLSENNEQRFWKVLERRLLDGRNDQAKELLRKLAVFYTNEKTYPEELGYKILRLIQALPPETRRLKVAFPLLPMSECIRLSQFAQKSDYEDVPLLFRAISGKMAASLEKESEINCSDSDRVDKSDAEKLSLVLSKIDADALTLVSLPIDSARAAYIMESITVKSHDEFIETISSFFIHLMRYCSRVSVSDPVDQNGVGVEAIALLERAFERKGGLQGAFSEAKSATNGGLRFVLDMMTERLKSEEKEKYVNHVLKLALDPLDWEGKVNLMGALLKRLGPHLPQEIMSQPPERFAGHHETIVRAYVQSIDQVKSLLRSL